MDENGKIFAKSANFSPTRDKWQRIADRQRLTIILVVTFFLTNFRRQTEKSVNGVESDG